jgi:hypothetical protein
MFKSSVPGSELAADGPIVKADDPKEPQLSYEAAKVI